MPYPFVPGEVLTSVNLNAALNQRMMADGTGLAFPPGAIIFGAATGKFATDSTNLWFDDTNNRLGIQTNTPQAMLQIGKTASTGRIYNSYTDTANGEWSYLGDWGGAFPNVSTFGSDKNGTGIIRDINFVRGGVEVLRFGTTGITTSTGISSAISATSLPVLLGTAAMAGAVRGVTVMGDYAYTINQVAGATDSLEIFDITIPTAPVKIGGLPFAAQGLGNNPIVAGQVLYSAVNAAGGGMTMIDVSNPKLPVSLGTLSVGGQIVQAFAVSGGYLYMGHTTSVTFRVYDITNPAAPTFHGNATMTGANATRGIIVSGKYAYVSTGQAVTGVGGLYIIDVSDPAVPVVVSTYNTISAFPIGMAITGKYLYVNSGGGTAGAIIEIVDISDPTAPVPVRTFATAGVSSSAHPIIAGDYLYHFNNTANGVQVINITDPANPVSVGTVVTAGTSANGGALRGNRLYVTANAQLRIYSTFGVESSSVRTGAIAADILSVDGASYFAGDIYAQRGLIVGQQGIHSRGPIFTDASEAAVPISAVFGLGLVCFGAFGSSGVPALKRAAALLQVRLSDDSALTGMEALTLALGGAGAATAGNPFDIRRDFDGTTNATITNASAGVAAQARAIYSNDASTGQLLVGVLGTGFTTNGLFVQDGATISAEAGLAGGLNIMTRAAAPIRFATNGQANERMQITSAGLITFGGITTAFPALKRNAAALEVRLADDSAYGNLTAGWLGLGTTAGSPFSMGGTFTSASGTVMFDMSTTFIGAATGYQYGAYIGPTFRPSGASLASISGVGVQPFFGGSVAISENTSLYVAQGDLTGYTGSNPSYGEAIFIDNYDGGSATKYYFNYYSILTASTINGHGVTTGTVNNFGIAIAGATAGAGIGGTISNQTLRVTVPSGAGAGTTGNYGILITGNGGSGGGGVTYNYAVISESTAIWLIQGSTKIGALTANPTNATAPFLYITASAGVPTGVPTYATSASVAIQYDSTNKKLMLYDPLTLTWKGVVVA